jgi:hypothetical protein
MVHGLSTATMRGPARGCAKARARCGRADAAFLASVRWPKRVARGTARRRSRSLAIDLFPTLTALVWCPERYATHRRLRPLHNVPRECGRRPASSPPARELVRQRSRVRARRPGGSSSSRIPTFRVATRGAEEQKPGTTRSAKAPKALYDPRSTTPAKPRTSARRIRRSSFGKLERVAEEARVELGDALTRRRGAETRPSGRLP